MGNWFSNLQIRKTQEVTTDKTCECIKSILREQGYSPAEHIEDADISVALLDCKSSQWITVVSKVFSHDDPDSCKAVAAPLSSGLNTEVLGIACFDSDYLYLNLINSCTETDAWLGIGAGKELGITRRNNLTAWKKNVSDYAAFSAASKNRYAFADEFLSAAEDSLGLPYMLSSLSPDNIPDSPVREEAEILYFRHMQDVRHSGPHLQICLLRYANPCFDGRKNTVSFISEGDTFRGLTVYFLGPYAEHEEITFSDVKIERYRQAPVVLNPEKIQLSDGRWAYCCREPDILLPPGIPRRMKPEKRQQLEMQQMCKLSFIPHGNPRKMLDITVMIVPDGNPDNPAIWNIWEQHGSKEAFIKHHNSIWKRVRAFEPDPSQCLPLLKIEDFDE